MGRDVRSALLDAAAAVFAANPGASLAEVAERAGVGRATLHRYFGGRREFVDALAREALERAAAVDADVAAAPSAREALRVLMEAMMPLGSRYRFLTQERITDPEIVREHERQLAELGELVDWLRAEGAVAPDVPTAWVVAVIDVLVYAGWEAIEAGTVAPRDAAGLAVRTVLAGLGPAGSSAASGGRGRG